MNAGSYPVAAAIVDALYQGSTSGTLVIAQASQSIAFNAPPAHTFGDAPFTLSGTASTGLPLSFSIVSGPATIGGSTVTLTGAGTVIVRASQSGAANYFAAPNVDQSFVVSKATASVALSNLSQMFDGQPKSAAVTTAPGGLATVMTYNGSPTLPVATGTYAVIATVNDSNYQGAASGTLVINPRSFTTDLTGWIATTATMANANTSSPLWNPGSAQSGIAGNAHSFFTPIQLATTGDSLRLSGSVTVSLPGGAAGSGLWFRYGLFYNPTPVVSSTDNISNWLGYSGMANSSAALYERTSSGNYGSSISGATSRTPQVIPASSNANAPSGSVTLAFSEMITRTGTGVDVTYSMVNVATSGTVMGFTFSDTTPNNNGLLTGAQSTSTNYSPSYSAAGFGFAGTYITSTNTSQAQFSNVQLTYTPATAGSAQTIVFAPIADHTFNDPAFGLSGTATSGLPVNFSIVSGPATVSGTMLTITGVGTVVVRATQAGNYSWLPAAVDQSFDIVKDTAVVALGTLNNTFDGDANPVTVTTTPSGLAVDVTYNGSSIAPTAIGTYAVVATVNDPDYDGSATGQLTISAPVFNWIDQTTGTDRLWSSPANWDGGTIPSGGVASVIAFFPSLALNSGTVTSNQDISSPFVLNVLDLNGVGPAIGTATVVIGGQQLSLISNETCSPVLSLSAMAGARFTYWINTPLSLQGPLTVQGNGTAEFISSGGITGPGTLTKNGSSTLTLAGSNTFTGATVVSEGCLVITGTLNGTASLSIAPGATLTIVGPGRCIVPGDITNLGTIRITNGARIEVSGALINRGVLDLITASSSLPAGLVNQGVILDSATASQAPDISVARTGVAITVQSYPGHGYKLQYATRLPSTSWVDVSATQDGTGGALLFIDPAGSSSSPRFYHIVISP